MDKGKSVKMNINKKTMIDYLTHCKGLKSNCPYIFLIIMMHEHLFYTRISFDHDILVTCACRFFFMRYIIGTMSNNHCLFPKKRVIKGI